MVTTWSESNEDSIEEVCTNKDVSMHFITLEDYENEINSSIKNNKLQNVFEKLYLDFEKFTLKNISIKKK